MTISANTITFNNSSGSLIGKIKAQKYDNDPVMGNTSYIVLEGSSESETMAISRTYEPAQDNSISGGVLSIDLTESSTFHVTCSGSLTNVNISNASPGQSANIVFTHSSSSTYSVTWALTGGTIKWATGSAPTLSSTSGEYDIVTVTCISSTEAILNFFTTTETSSGEGTGSGSGSGSTDEVLLSYYKMRTGSKSNQDTSYSGSGATAGMVYKQTLPNSQIIYTSVQSANSNHYLAQLFADTGTYYTANTITNSGLRVQFVYELNESKTITRIGIHGKPVADYLYKMVIEYWDGSSYQESDTLNFPSGIYNEEITLSSTFETQYVRLNFYGNASDSQYNEHHFKRFFIWGNV